MSLETQTAQLIFVQEKATGDFGVVALESKYDSECSKISIYEGDKLTFKRSED